MKEEGQSLHILIARILDYGDIKDLRKLLELYPREEIIKVVKTRRGLLPKTGKYWAVKLDIPFEEVACLRKHYQKKLSKAGCKAIDGRGL